MENVVVIVVWGYMWYIDITPNVSVLCNQRPLMSRFIPPSVSITKHLIPSGTNLEQEHQKQTQED